MEWRRDDGSHFDPWIRDPRARRRRDHRARAAVDGDARARSRTGRSGPGCASPRTASTSSRAGSRRSSSGRRRHARRAERLDATPRLGGQPDELAVALDEPVAQRATRPPPRRVPRPARLLRDERAAAPRGAGGTSPRSATACAAARSGARATGSRSASGQRRSAECGRGRSSRRGRTAPARTPARTRARSAPGPRARSCRPGSTASPKAKFRIAAAVYGPTPGSLVRSSGQPRAATTARRAVQAERAPVVAEPLPLADHLRRRRRPRAPRASASARASEPARDDALDLRLLQHHLADEDRVRIARPAPGQIAAVFRVPRREELVHGREPSRARPAARFFSAGVV